MVWNLENTTPERSIRMKIKVPSSQEEADFQRVVYAPTYVHTHPGAQLVLFLGKVCYKPQQNVSVKRARLSPGYGTAHNQQTPAHSSSGSWILAPVGNRGRNVQSVTCSNVMTIVSLPSL